MTVKGVTVLDPLPGTTVLRSGAEADVGLPTTALGQQAAVRS